MFSSLFLRLPDVNNESLDRLLRQTRRKLFVARWLTASVTFYFYAFFIGTALILTDRIGGEVDLWTPFTLEWVILTSVVVTLFAGGLYGLFHAWWNRCSKRELAWMIDRRCDAGALLVTALEADEIELDTSWSSLIEEQATELTNTYLRRNLFRLPGQGIRWMFLFALLLDLGLVVFLTPVYKPVRPVTDRPADEEQRARKEGEGSGSAQTSGKKGKGQNGKGKTGESEEAKNGKNDKSDETASGRKKNKRSKKDRKKNNAPPREDPPLFGEEERHEHERDPKVVKEKAEQGPTRDGLVRVFDSGDSEDGSGSGTGSGNGDSGKGDSGKSNPDPRRAEALHRQYQRQAERMIWRRSLSPDEKELVRRYYEEIRPDPAGPEEPDENPQQQ